ncbi:hypothetical protein MRX96_056292 [Rhipicephalus microplus]
MVLGLFGSSSAFPLLQVTEKQVSSRGLWKTLLPPAVIVLLSGVLLTFFVIMSRKEVDYYSAGGTNRRAWKRSRKWQCWGGHETPANRAARRGNDHQWNLQTRRLPTTDEHGTTAESLIVTSEEDSIISNEVSDTSQAQVTDETTFPTSLPEETTEPSTPNSVSSLGVTLLCTVNQFVNRSMVAPEDGLCELTFYDSFFKNQTYDLAAPYNDKFNYFIELATQHVKTEYGAAFAYSYEESKDVLDKALSDNPSKVQADLMNLLHQNITHFGTVDIGHVRFGPSVLKRVLRNLKRVYDIVEDKRSNQRPVYTIMTIPMYLNDSGVWMKEMSDYLNHSGLPLHGVIAIPHLTENDLTSGYACRIVPPMFLNAPNIPEELERLNPYTYSMVISSPPLAYVMNSGSFRAATFT